MTILAALWNYDSRPAAPACNAMLEAQAGVDGHNIVVGRDGMVLGQGTCHPPLRNGYDGGPVVGASGALTLVADVRLDNRADLLSRLGRAAPSSASCSDARLMMSCFERWGEDAVGDLIGDFALALWDKRSERLLLARDFAGQRPLFFCETNRALAVASMARGLHTLDNVPRAVDEARMMEMLAGLPHRGRGTFFQGIERVEPGEALTFQRRARASRIFWTLPVGELRLRSAGEYAEALNEKLDQAVVARLRGVQGAVGSHLSAGLDSSAVTAAAALAWDGPVHAYTSVPSGTLPLLPEGRFGDEGALAAETAAMYPNIEHHLIPVGSRIPMEDLGGELGLYERPDLNLPNLVWANRINDAAAAAGITVMLTGTSGNATISYGGLEILRDLLAEGRIGTFLAESAFALKAGVRMQALLGVAARHYLPSVILRPLDRFRNREQHPAGAGALNLSAAGAAEIVARYERNATWGFGSSVDVRLHMLRRVDPATYNKGVLMRWNIDLRDPTADRRLVEFCLKVPLHQYLRKGRSRALIRTALEGRVPESVRCDRRRGLQSANWFSLLSGARAEMAGLLAGIRRCDAARKLLDVDAMGHMLEAWPASSASYGPMAYRYGLLRGLAAGEFIRIHDANDRERTSKFDRPTFPP
jgi:asparagine synthase (glutamine-hydrolysing)